MAQSQLQMLLARQSIYDKRGFIHAYELLYRKSHEHQSNVDNTDELAGVQATSSVISQLFTNFDIDLIIGNKLAFINFNYTDLVHKIPALLPRDRIIIEVLETTAVDQELISALMELNNEGYKIALDDFVWREELIPLINIADIIKLDVLNQNKEDIMKQMMQLKGFQGKFLAEKIDNQEQFKCCVDLGFDYFQGFFLNKTDVFTGQAFTENKSQVLRVLAELNKDDISIEKLVNIIMEIPKLSYRILRISNSVHYFSGKENHSLTDAIFRLGLTKIRNWTNLLLLASDADTSPELLERTLIRAKMCESLAKLTKHVNPQEAYTVGIFSTLDGMLNEPLHSLLAKIQLGESINNALLRYQGPLGQLLGYAMDYEQANFSNLENTQFVRQQLTNSYLEGIKYANGILKTLE